MLPKDSEERVLRPKENLRRVKTIDDLGDGYAVPERGSAVNKKSDGVDRQKRIEKLAQKRQKILEKFSAPLIMQGVKDYVYRYPDKRFLEHLFSENYKPTWLQSEDTSKVFYDIETKNLKKDEDIGALYPTRSTHNTERIRVGLAVSIARDGQVRCWEGGQVFELIDYLLSFDEIVSFNGLRFDNYVLKGYLNDQDRIQELSNKTFDMMLYLMEQKRTYRRISLDRARREYLDRPRERAFTEDSSRVPELLEFGSKEAKKWIWEYCFWDVEELVELYNNFQIDIDDKLRFYDWFLSWAVDGLLEAVSEELRILFSPSGIQATKLHLNEKNSKVEGTWYSGYTVPGTDYVNSKYRERRGKFKGGLSFILEKVRNYEEENIEQVLSYFVEQGFGASGFDFQFIDWSFLKEEGVGQFESEYLLLHPKLRRQALYEKEELSYNDSFYGELFYDEDPYGKKFYGGASLLDQKVMSKLILPERILRREDITKIIPGDIIEETDFILQEISPWGPRFYEEYQKEKRAGFSFRNEKGKVYGVFNYLGLPEVRDDLNGLEEFDLIFCEQITGQAEDYLSENRTFHKVKELSLDKLLEYEVVSPLDLPDCEEFKRFLQEKIKPLVLKLVRSQERMIASEFEKSVKEHRQKCQKAREKLDPLLSELGKKELEAEDLICQYNLIFAHYLTYGEIKTAELDEISAELEKITAELEHF